MEESANTQIFANRAPAAPPRAPVAPTLAAPAAPVATPTAPVRETEVVSEPTHSRTRVARLRLVQVDAWSVMKTSFLLSIALGIVSVVAVTVIWAVLNSAGVFDSINSVVGQTIGGEGAPIQVEEYLSGSRVIGFAMIVAVADVVLLTAIATLTAFLYNLAASLLGGIEVTWAEDRH